MNEEPDGGEQQWLHDLIRDAIADTPEAVEYFDRIIVDHKAAAAAGELLSLLADLIDEMPACDKDESRDYCMTHHTRHCEVEAMIAKARAAIAAAEKAGIKPNE